MYRNRTWIAGLAAAALAATGAGIAQSVLRDTKSTPVASMEALELQALKKKVSQKFTSAKLSDVLAWLSLEELSFVADTSSFPDRTATLNFVNQPLGTVLDVVANVYGGKWERNGDIFTLKPRALSPLLSESPAFAPLPPAKVADPKVFEFKTLPKEFVMDPKELPKVEGHFVVPSPNVQDPKVWEKMHEEWAKSFAEGMKKSDGVWVWDGQKMSPEEAKAFAKRQEEWAKSFEQKMKAFAEKMEKEAPKWEAWSKEFAEKFTKDFDGKTFVLQGEKMTPEQKAKLEEHMKKLHGELGAKMKELDPKIKALIEKELKMLPEHMKSKEFMLHGDKLTPEQKAKLEEHMKKLHGELGMKMKELDPKIKALVEKELKMLPEHLKSKEFMFHGDKLTPEQKAKMEEHMKKLHQEMKIELKDLAPKIKAEIEAHMKGMPEHFKGKVFVMPDVKIDATPFKGLTPKSPMAGSSTIRLTELLESLSADQKAKMKEQGHLKATDLNAKQRELLGPLKGNWSIVFSKDGQTMTIKSG